MKNLYFCQALDQRVNLFDFAEAQNVAVSLSHSAKLLILVKFLFNYNYAKLLNTIRRYSNSNRKITQKVRNDTIPGLMYSICLIAEYLDRYLLSRHCTADQLCFIILLLTFPMYFQVPVNH